MGKFKVGDRVRILHTDFPECGLDVGSVHEIQEKDDDVIFLKAEDGCYLAFYTHEVEPAPENTIQLNQPYTSKNGTKWECIGIKDGIAWLAGEGDGDAYRFLLNGENLSQGGGLWDIQWEPVVEWVDNYAWLNEDGSSYHMAEDGSDDYSDGHKVRILLPLIDGNPDFTQAIVTPA